MLSKPYNMRYVISAELRKPYNSSYVVLACMKRVRLFKAYNVSYMVFAQKKVRLFVVVLMHKQRNFRSCGLYIYIFCVTVHICYLFFSFVCAHHYQDGRSTLTATSSSTLECH